MEKPILHRREAIIVTSIEVINEFGIQGLSTREVANRQGVTEAAIFKHFKTKNELIIAILDHYSQYDADIAASIKLKNLEPIIAINYFIGAYAEYYENYPQITAITQAYDVLSYDQELAEKVKKIFMQRLNSMKALIVEAQKCGQISSSIDNEKLAHVLWGSFNEVCLKWRLGGFKFPLKEYIISTLKIILDAFVINK